MSLPENHKHVRATHKGCYDMACIVCNLYICQVCDGIEGSLATQCPGRKITEEERGLIYNEKLDFRDGEWVTLSPELANERRCR